MFGDVKDLMYLATMEKNKVVYYHRRKDTGEVFYVGIGNNKRPYSKSNRNNYWSNIVNKVGYDVDIIHTDLTWDESSALEIQYIKEFGRKDLGLGNLVNMTNGGDGANSFSPEIRKRCGHKKGTKFSKEVCENMSKSFLGIKKSETHRINISKKLKGLKKTDTHIKNMSIAFNKNKSHVGIRHSKSILTDKDVIWIRKFYDADSKYNIKFMMKKFHVSKGCICKVIYNQSWKHLI